MTALYKYFLTASVILLSCISVSGQQTADSAAVRNDLRKAGIFHRNYQFGKAIEYYTDAMNKAADSSLKLNILEKIVQCRNGESMMEYIVRPEEIASRIFSKDEFVLYLNEFEDNSWIPVPNPLIKATARQVNPFYTSMLFQKDRNSVIFSAPDDSGAWNLYTSSRKDSLTWTAPVLLSENVLSDRNEIFPILSPDGRTLFFASDGMPGMGGYDLFYSVWDDGTDDWSTPENLGFPYSSTGDDILFLNSSDGSSSIIVSNRETDADSVKIYVTKYIATPVKTPLGKDESPLLISSFTRRAAPESRPEENGDGTEDSYSLLMHQLRRLQGEQREKLAKIAESRKVYESASEEDRKFLAGIIRDIEQESMNIKKEIDGLNAKVREMETSFLANGIIPAASFDDSEPESQGKMPASKAEYIFRKHAPGRVPYIIVETPEPEFDYSFKILGRDKGQFAEDNTLPAGIIYQIQFAVLGSHAQVKDIRGMSPVFVTRMPSGKYLHTVGVFSTYREALSNLNRVRKNGFPEAFIIAFDNGKSISVKNARSQEGQTRTTSQSSSSGELAYRIILSGYSSTLPDSVMETIQRLCSKDITRSTSDDGETVFAIGPFNTRSEAESISGELQENDIETQIESIKL